MTVRKVEAALLDAIRNCQRFNRGNTSYDPVQREVRLHGNLIAVLDKPPRYTLAGWPTNTTRNRINTIARVATGHWLVRQSKGKQLHRDGRELSPNEWFT